MLYVSRLKDSIPSTLATIQAVTASELRQPCEYIIYDDNSTVENAERLQALSKEYGFTLVHLSDLTDHPSPNYLFVLQREQQLCREQGCGLMIVESDVVVQPHTLQALADAAAQRPDCGIAAAVTVDDSGRINYPYDYARGREQQVIDNKKHCSFCCSLLTPALLGTFDFQTLNPEKHWFDVTISHESLKAGLHNYLFTTLPVVHRPHSSRPWKQLKYKNPLLYYWRKFIGRQDKI
ncbi:MAG: glycosyltransferase family 2 protein [Bacteroidaceae bacterium]|nr:glycosyltransferase family 2 protein [Bacteroidaceae bacterium]